ncbi:hypothetical protein AU381_20895, partial [Sinorhizobium glycinis]
MSSSLWIPSFDWIASPAALQRRAPFQTHKRSLQHFELLHVFILDDVDAPAPAVAAMMPASYPQQKRSV